MNSRSKLAIVVSHPIQHFSPVYQLLGNSHNIDLNVIYYSDAGARESYNSEFGLKYKWDVDLMTGYDSTILEPGESVDSKGFWKIASKHLESVLDQIQPDHVLIYGYAHRLEWQSLHWVKRNNKKLLYFSDSSLSSLRNMWKRMLKAIPVRYFLKHIDVGLAVGDQNVQYLKHYGVTGNRVKACPLSVDLRRFQIIERGKILAFRKEVRQQYAIEEDAFIVLFSGKLIARKCPMDLLKAVLALHRSGRKVVALFLGSGELLESLQSELDNSTSPEAVRFAGFINQKEIVRFQYAADALAITSQRDAHPLVVTEAAACGLPIIASDHVGCIGATDTIQEGVNALVYPLGDIEALKNCIKRLIDEPGELEKLGKASLEIAKTQDISVAAAAIEDAVFKTQYAIT
jgi:glycosyltransferase involved in cell wall biosynthesis